MIFTKLRLLGFKSFVEATDVPIEPGLTGVVGPNGCGKSNLVEALRWVMGESSHKAMRAADMDDVIFNGSGGRPARNTAEVTIFVDNADRTAPAPMNDTDELQVSRRIVRDQGSTYRVNGREARARDVQLLFADASSGARSPAMVRQGQIGEIINARPQARRRILEEAAGISGLHARRHEAEIRLRGAEHNLERLEDVIAQIGQQVDGLRRQSRQAIRYRALSAEIRKAQSTLFGLRARAAAAEIVAADRAVDEATREVAAATGVQAAAATKQAVAAHEMPALREAEVRAAAALTRLRVARETLDRDEARLKDRAAEIDRRLAQLQGDVERERMLAADAASVLARLAGEEQALLAEGDGAVARREAAEAALAAAEAALARTERAFAEATRTVAELAARRNQIERAIKDGTARMIRLEGQIAEIDREETSLVAGEGPDIAALREAAATAAAALEAADAAMLRAEAAHSAARQALDLARKPAAEAERRVQRLETEARTLAKVLQVDATRMWPPVLDLVRVEKGFETALGAALGDDLEAPVDGQAPVRWAGVAVPDGDPALPEGAVPLARHVAGPPALARRLAQVGVVAREEGARLAARLAPGQRLVSRDGDLWRWDGFCASANAPTAAARRLAERNRLGEIEAELAQARAELDAKRKALAAAEADVQAAAGAEAAAREGWRTTRRQLDAARESLERGERRAADLATRLSALVEARVRLAASRDEAEAHKREALAALDALPEGATLEAELAEIRAAVALDRARLGEARAEAQGLVRETEARQRRLAAIAQERSQWAERSDGADGRIAAIEERITEATAERATLADAPAAMAAQRRALVGEIEAAELARRAAADALVAAETRLAEADHEARQALEGLGRAREASARAEERRDAARRREADLTREIADALGLEPEAVAKLAAAADPAQDAHAVEAELDRLLRERERLGAVNLRAEEELKEVETQHATLIAERDDLVEAIKRLRAAIQSLNREARERLSASFATVDGHFRRLFGELFGGGEAQLVLTESDDPLEAGLDIIAKPPGKKPQTLSLLSGGEQALTAMALIFAVFLTNPAPICVLDEVDAPLDDANVERFCNLLDEMIRAARTRFLVITHNPITMARMDRLFGVTMAERGISRLVSVDLATAERIREAV